MSPAAGYKRWDTFLGGLSASPRKCDKMCLAHRRRAARDRPKKCAGPFLVFENERYMFHIFVRIRKTFANSHGHSHYKDYTQKKKENNNSRRQLGVVVHLVEFVGMTARYRASTYDLLIGNPQSGNHKHAQVDCHSHETRHNQGTPTKADDDSASPSASRQSPGGRGGWVVGDRHSSLGALSLLLILTWVLPLSGPQTTLVSRN